MNIGYVTISYADEYVSTHYLEDEVERESWEDLDDESKEILLRRSFEINEKLPYTGRKSSVAQPNTFPRFPNTEVPEDVKRAQVEGALFYANESASDSDFYNQMYAHGVKSFSIGNLSESLSSPNEFNSSRSSVPKKALQLLTPYTYGGYSI